MAHSFVIATGDVIDKYTIVRHKYGRYIEGDVPIHDLLALTEAWKGKDVVLHPGIAHALGASVVVTTTKYISAWRKDVDAAALARAGGDKELAWLWSSRFGQSACVIMATAATSKSAKSLATVYLKGVYPVPLDMDDWGRCRAVMELIGLTNLECMRRVSPGWAAVADATEELCTLNKMDSARAKAIFDRIAKAA